jgi:hypothetical protein
VNGVPIVAVAVSGLVIEGASWQIVITSVALPVLHGLAPLLALIVTEYVPAVVGVPQISFWGCCPGGGPSCSPGGKAPVTV